MFHNSLQGADMPRAEDDVVCEFLAVTDYDPFQAMKRMALSIALARDHAEDALPKGGMSGSELARLWRDLHPNEFEH